MRSIRQVIEFENFKNIKQTEKVKRKEKEIVNEEKKGTNNSYYVVIIHYPRSDNMIFKHILSQFQELDLEAKCIDNACPLTESSNHHVNSKLFFQHKIFLL